MSRLVKVVCGAAAVLLALGAVQFASGHDLTMPLLSGNVDGVNRAAKADRAAMMRPAAPSRTIAFSLRDLAETSVAVRIARTKEAHETVRPLPPIRSGQQSGQGKPMVACEPVVSVLTEVARELPPGRCVT
jgi:hypothetical protein